MIKNLFTNRIQETTRVRAMFAGDIHGNINHLKWLFDHASKNDITHIISVGDFGYWVHLKRGVKFISAVERLAKSHNIKVLWIDGNHENHDILNELVDIYGDSAPIPTPSEWVKWIPRGCIFTLGATTIMGYGGAWSVDWKQRVEGESWWRQELIDPFHVDDLPEVHVDILITHDAPMGKTLSYKDDIPLSVNQRVLVSEIMSKVTPDMVICGHHHVRETWYQNETQINVLGRDEMGPQSVLVMDL